MPTYDYRCPQCGAVHAVFQSISEYVSNPRIPACIECDHGKMERKLAVTPAMSGLANALAGDRHYENMQASDGTDISSRTKHREYMKRNGLTTTDDYTKTWAKEERRRTELRQGNFVDKELRSVLTEKVMTEVAKPD